MKKIDANVRATLSRERGRLCPESVDAYVQGAWTPMSRERGHLCPESVDAYVQGTWTPMSKVSRRNETV